MITSAIIAKFNLYVDDGSELSSPEELALANKIYRQVLDEKDWEFLKTEYSGTTSVSVPYIALPADFKNIVVNYDDEDGEPSQVVFVGPNHDVYKVIPFSQRRNYRDVSGFCYIDKKQNRLYFTEQPKGAYDVEFDYVYNPDDLTLTTSPVWDSIHHDIIHHAMVIDFYSIEQTEKTRSYYQENLIAYAKVLQRMSNVNMKNSGLISY